MGAKRRPPKFRGHVSREDAQEMYRELSRGWLESKALKAFVRRLGAWLDANPNTGSEGVQ